MSSAKRQSILSLSQCSLGFDMWQVRADLSEIHTKPLQIFIIFQFWVFTKNGYLKTDEHQCLQGAEVSKTWIVQTKECGESDREVWDYKEYVLIIHRNRKREIPSQYDFLIFRKNN